MGTLRAHTSAIGCIGLIVLQGVTPTQAQVRGTVQSSLSYLAMHCIIATGRHNLINSCMQTVFPHVCTHIDLDSILKRCLYIAHAICESTYQCEIHKQTVGPCLSVCQLGMREYGYIPRIYMTHKHTNCAHYI